MNHWLLYAFYALLLGSPLLFFVATKPGYEKTPQQPSHKKPATAKFAHTAKQNSGAAQKPADGFLNSSSPRRTARRSG